jgi:hypothetical protein
MPAMNISLQRRIGKLPKSPDYLDNIKPTIFENNHRGFGTRTPTPTYKGFFGIGKAHKGSSSNEMGDGLNTAWYGNDGGRSLPAPGIYGIGSAPGEETIMTSSMDNRPAHWGTPGLFGGTGEAKSFVTQNWVPLAVVGGMLYYLRK